MRFAHQELARPAYLATLRSEEPDWWRPLTAVFLQNNVSGAAWSLITLAAIAALAEWVWGPVAMLILFVVGALLPEHLDALFGTGGRSTGPRNFVSSSGATYFLASTLAAALLFAWARHRRGSTPLPRFAETSGKAALLALAVPVGGLIMWLAQANGHGS